MKKHHCEKGFSLIELAVVLAIFAISMGATIPVITGALRQQKTFESKADSKSYQRILEKVVQKSLIAIRPEHFNPAESYVYSSDLINSKNLMGLNGKIVPPFNESLTVDFRDAGKEKASFVDAAVKLPNTNYSMQLNSFTLGVMKVDVNSGTGKLEGSLSRLLITRCIRNGEFMEGEGGTIDGEAPIKSTMRVLGENRYPFLGVTNGRAEVRCCLINQTNCTRTYPRFVPKIYAVTLDKGVPQSIREYPNIANRESLGSGFITTFNERNNANYYRTIFFDLENTCQLTASGQTSCKENNPGNHLKNAGVLKLDASFVKKSISTRSFIRFGRVKKGFESSGVIVLGE